MAAVRASQIGAKVMIIEKNTIGGICSNWGCIPMLALTWFAKVIQLAKGVEDAGINVGEVNLDFAKLFAAKNKAIESVNNRMRRRLQLTKVEVLNGYGRLISPKQVEIEIDGGSKEIVKANKIIVATGSVPRRYSIPGAYGTRVITARELLDLNTVPKSLIVIGRSVLALELATVWANLGSEVTLIGRKPKILPGEDEELATYIESIMKGDGIQMYMGVDIERVDDNYEGGKSVNISRNGVSHELKAEVVVFAVGQSPLVEGVGLENVGVAINEGRVKTNSRMETNVDGIYAAGDVTGEILLANVALDQGKVAGENAMGGDSVMDYRVVPRFARTLPPIAAVGITENQAKERGIDVRIGRFSFDDSPNANVYHERSGFVKVIADAGSGEILGVHIIGPDAIELIGEAAIIMKMRCTVQDVYSTTHAHPALHEGIKSALFGMYAQSFYAGDKGSLHR